MMDTIKRKFSYGYVCDNDCAALSCSGNMKTSATCNHNNSKDLLCSGQLKKYFQYFHVVIFKMASLREDLRNMFPVSD